LKISIFGLGYVGTVSAGCLANDGHEVIGVDPVRTKVDLINQGQSPIVEADIASLISTTVESGHLRATDDATEAVHRTDLSFVCVGTPSQPNGNLDLRHVRRVCEQIGAANQDPEFKQVPARMRGDQVIVDFVRIANRRSEEGKYDGICW
jgi:GDP-mannose 6-dehydrogenase